MFAHDAKNDRQPQSGAYPGRLGGKERVKDPHHDGLGNSRTVVANFEKHPAFVGPLCAHPNVSAFAGFLDGLPRISD
jgi:hypothetical protein